MVKTISNKHEWFVDYELKKEASIESDLEKKYPHLKAQITEASNAVEKKYLRWVIDNLAKSTNNSTEAEFKYIYTKLLDYLNEFVKFKKLLSKPDIYQYDLSTLIKEVSGIKSQIPKAKQYSEVYFDKMRELKLEKSREESYREMREWLNNVEPPVLQNLVRKEIRGIIKEREISRGTEQEARQYSDVIFENDDLLIVMPGTTQASKYYGSGTRWCTAAEEDNYFFEYSNNGIYLYYVIIKNAEQDDPYKKIAFAAIKVDGGVKINDVFDANDNMLGDDLTQIMVAGKYSLSSLADKVKDDVSKRDFNKHSEVMSSISPESVNKELSKLSGDSMWNYIRALIENNKDPGIIDVIKSYTDSEVEDRLPWIRKNQKYAWFFSNKLDKVYPDLAKEFVDNMVKNNDQDLIYYGLQEYAPGEIKSIAEDMAKQNPKSFFYYSLEREYPDLSIVAGRRLIEIDPVSFFHNSVDEIVPELAEEAARSIFSKSGLGYNLDVFFRYGLDKRFPDVLREVVTKSASVEVFDRKLHKIFPKEAEPYAFFLAKRHPSWFFDYRLEDTYPQYVDLAKNNMNVKISKRAQLDYPHKMFEAIFEWAMKSIPKLKGGLFRRGNEEASNVFEIDVSDTNQFQKHSWMLKLLNEAQALGWDKKLTVRLFGDGFEDQAVKIKDYAESFFREDQIEDTKDKAWYGESNGEHEIWVFGALRQSKSQELELSLKHELTHMMQNVLNTVISMKQERKFEDAGLPSKPKVETDDLPHAAMGIEFYPILNEEILRLKDYVSNSVSENDLKERFKEYVEKSKKLHDLKQVDQGMYQKMLGELYNAVVSGHMFKGAEVNDTAGVFAVIPKDIAKQFPSLGNHDNSDPHITVLFVGKIPKSKRKLFQEVVENVSKVWKPFKANIDKKVSYFPPSKNSDNCKIAKMSIVSKELHKFHDELKKAVEYAGIEIDNTFPDYKPHITLEYMEEGKEKYDKDIPKGSWTVDEVQVWGIGKNKKCKLNGQKKETYISKRAEAGLSKGDLEEIFGLEWMMKELYGRGDQESIQYFNMLSGELGLKLDRANTIMLGVFNNWLKEHKVLHGDLNDPNEVQKTIEYLLAQSDVDTDEDGWMSQLAEEQVAEWKQTFNRVNNIANDLKQSKALELRKKIQTFHQALQTTHNTGEMLDYVSYTVDDPDQRVSVQFLDQLSAIDNPYIKKWQKELRRFGSISEKDELLQRYYKVKEKYKDLFDKYKDQPRPVSIRNQEKEENRLLEEEQIRLMKHLKDSDDEKLKKYLEVRREYSDLYEKYNFPKVSKRH